MHTPAHNRMHASQSDFWDPNADPEALGERGFGIGQWKLQDHFQNRQNYAHRMVCCVLPFACMESTLFAVWLREQFDPTSSKSSQQLGGPSCRLSSVCTSNQYSYLETGTGGRDAAGQSQFSSADAVQPVRRAKRILHTRRRSAEREC